MEQVVNNIKISETGRLEQLHLATYTCSSFNNGRFIRKSGEKKGDDHGWEEENWEDYPAEFDLYQGFHNFLAPQAKKLVTHHDLREYKTCIDLGGEYF